MHINHVLTFERSPVDNNLVNQLSQNAWLVGFSGQCGYCYANMQPFYFKVKCKGAQAILFSGESSQWLNKHFLGKASASTNENNNNKNPNRSKTALKKSGRRASGECSCLGCLYLGLEMDSVSLFPHLSLQGLSWVHWFCKTSLKFKRESLEVRNVLK